MRLKSVDLPAPFGPIRAWRWPRFTMRSTPRMISVSPNDFRTFRSSSMGSPETAPGTGIVAFEGPRLLMPSPPDGPQLGTDHRASEATAHVSRATTPWPSLVAPPEAVASPHQAA